MKGGLEVRVERLLGRPVLAGHGQSVGRIEELRAEKRGTGYVVVAFVVGREGLLERLSSGTRRFLGVGGHGHGHVIPWDALDLSDPERPRLRGRLADVAKDAP